MKTNETTTRLRTDARALGLSNDTIDDLFEWAMPRHIDAVARMLARECVLAICVPHCEQCFSAG